MTYFQRPIEGHRLSADAVLDILHAARPAWQARAACAGRSDVMFPEASRGRGADYREALATCRRCPVLNECRTWSAAEEHGVWGGEIKEARAEVRTVPLGDDEWRTVQQIARAAAIPAGEARRELRRLLRRGDVEAVDADHGGRLYRRTDRRRDNP